MTFPYGVDTSLYQIADPAGLLVGCNFGIHKVSEAAFEDPDNASELAEQKAVRSIIGTIGYHYLRLSPSAEVQAAFYLAHCGAVDAHAVDYEAEVVGHPDVARAFIAYVKAHDKRKIGLYGSEFNGWPGAIGQDFDWVANYSAVPKRHWDFHQFTSRPWDQNHYNGTLAQLAAFFGKPAPTTVLSSDTPLVNLFPRTSLSYVVPLPKGAVLYANGKPYTTISAPIKLALLGATGSHFEVADGDAGVWVPRKGLIPEPTETPVTVGA